MNKKTSWQEELADNEYMRQNVTGNLPVGRPFSLLLYLLIVFGLSWPFQIIAAIWGLDLLPRYTLHAASMCMVGLGTFLAGRYVFKDGFERGGWNWGRARHYITITGLISLLWIVPMFFDIAFDKIKPSDWTSTEIIWVSVFLINFLPPFGEEIGWRGYMLSRLAQSHSPRKAVLIHAIIWWSWHIPGLAGIGAWTGITMAQEMQMPPVAAAIIMAIVVVLVTAIPAILHGILFAYIWVWSGSLAVVIFYHLMYDGVRDSIQSFIGSGTVSGILPMVVIVLLGTILLWKGNWDTLEEFKNEKKKF